MIPVRITLNNPGSSILGEIVVEMPGRRSEGNIIYAQTVELPQHSEKVIWMSLPAIHFTKDNNHVRLYRTHQNKNELIPFKQGEVSITTRQIQNQSHVIGLLTADKDTFNFIQLLNNQTTQYFPIHLTKEELPDEASMLSILSHLVINDYATGQLSEAQIMAIEGWVQSGGQLIVAGGSSYPRAIEVFKTLSPIEYEGTVTLDQLDSLVEVTGRELPLTSPVTLSHGSLIDGEVLLAEDGIPLYVKRDIQFGSVLYVAYDLSTNPLASWNGNSEIWQRLLESEATILRLADNDLWQIDRALNEFTELTPPNIGVLILFFIGYIIVVAPLLFFVLKKWDKRELAWVLIPIISVLTSVTVFLVGSTGRMSVLAQSLNVIEMNAEGHGFKKSYSSFFVPRGGSYTVGDLEGHIVSSFGFHMQGGNQSLSGQYEQKIYNEGDIDRIEFRKIPYRSIRKLQSVDAQARTYEPLDYEIKITAAGVTGHIKNTTNYELRHVSLFMNDGLYHLGHLQQGEELLLLQAMSQPTYTGHYYGSLRYSHPNFNDLSTYEDALLQNVLNKTHQISGTKKPFFVALSQEIKPTLEIDGKVINVDQTNVWVWHIDDLSYIDGKDVFIPFGTIVPTIVESDATYLNEDKYNNHINMGKGSIEFVFRIPDMVNVVYTGVTLETYVNGMGFDQLIWNGEEEQWVRFSHTMTFDAEFIERNTVRIRYVNQHDEHYYFQYPRISLEGVVLDD